MTFSTRTPTSLRSNFADSSGQVSDATQDVPFEAPAEMTLRVRNLDYDVVLTDGDDAGETKRILSDVTVDFPTGKITAIMVGD